jgi:hypothetical protein
LAGDGQLPALLDPSDALRRVGAQALQDHEADQHQGNVADHSGVGEALAGAQPGVLFGVTEDRLDGLANINRDLTSASMASLICSWSVPVPSAGTQQMGTPATSVFTRAIS